MRSSVCKVISARYAKVAGSGCRINGLTGRLHSTAKLAVNPATPKNQLHVFMLIYQKVHNLICKKVTNSFSQKLDNHKFFSLCVLNDETMTYIYQDECLQLIDVVFKLTEKLLALEIYAHKIYLHLISIV